MGWTILYIAFGLVALWLLGEVLLQYKARLRWRLLAFTGFLGVVIGVIIPSVIVIGLGLIAFAIGQTQVTLSFRRGFTTGWALGGKPGESRRRRGRPSGPPPAEPTLQVSGVEAVPPSDGAGPAADGGPDTFESTGGFMSRDAFAAQETMVGGNAFAAQETMVGQNAFTAQETFSGQGSYGGPGYDYNADDGYGRQDPYPPQQDQDAYATQPFAVQDDYGRADGAAVYAPQPMPDETGQYGIYSSDARGRQTGYDYDAYNGAAGNGNSDGSGNGYAYDGSYGQGPAAQDAYAADPYAAYGDNPGQGGQLPYPDPYLGTQQYAAPYDPYEQPDPYAQPPYAAQQYDSQGQPLGQYGQGQYPGQGYGETPPGGVWVPQQRDAELPPEQQPYPPYQQPGYDGQQYRY
ncbi:hypothetical protein [Streptomyces tubercidicus]|uniref:Uncharacterized protein n=1 Tax=Streptomyces tubercidicus TaxID=47759 RepID=A0A640V0K2_9ACTN|nr:hypothetical protein [Streptomyces tubercidicus]WAU14670.1 hypothetical protein STRTU_005299 [Streptomyces tubercidicus]GFE40425.1 hypothetical protein Stube_50980 [Streptomyces tubercidicus]